MILTRIAVRNFRGVRHAVFDALSDRMCLFYGPNESGKSTLVEALHFALFERAAGQAQHKRDLQSWGGTEPPEVEVSFVDAEGEPWHVEKRFLVQPRATLAGRNLVLQDDAAEQRLRAMLHTREGTKYGTTPADLGIWPLLWVRQGEASTPLKQALNADAREALSTTLAAATGALAAGPVGRALREAVAEAWSRSFSPSGRESRDHRAVIDAAEQAERDRDDLHERWIATRATAEEVARRQDELSRLEARIAEQQRALRAAHQRVEAARAAATSLQGAERRLALARQEADQADRALAERTATAEALAEALRVAAAADAALAAATEQARAADARRHELRRAAEVAEAAAVVARREVERVHRRAERDRLVAEVDDLRDRLGQAEAAERALRSLQEAVDAVPIRRGEVERLEHLAQLRDRARDRLDAAAARVVITAHAPTTLDDAPLAPGQVRELRLHAPAELRLPGVTVAVHPGAGDLDALHEALARAEDDVTRQCAALDVPDLAEARARLDRRSRLEREREEHAARLGVLARDGIHPLRERLARVQARLAAITAHEGQALDADAAQAAAAQAEQVFEAARAAQRAHEDAWQRAQEGLAEARGAARAAAAEAARLQARDAELPPLATLTAASEAARADLATAREAHRACEAAFREAGGEQVEHDAAALQQAVEKLLARRSEAHEALARLQATLEERHAEGLYDQLQDALAHAEAARAEADAAVRAAAARQLLRDALEASWLGLRDHLAGPVQEAVEDGVRILFPGSTLAVDDDGDVIGLRTGDVVETFDQLSGGAREQLGILVRLGLARVLAGERRLPVILDDALVNSDAERRGRMVEVLRRASEHLQILVLTCHDEDFDRLAAPWQREVLGRPGRTARAG